MTFYVDTREPKIVKQYARALGFIPMALDVGDFSSNKVIIERKKASDLIASCYGKAYNQAKPRLSDQAERIFEACNNKERIPILLITGNLDKAIAKIESKAHIKINKNVIYGTVASVFVRCAIHVIWTEQPLKEWLKEIHFIMTKIEEGKYLLPKRKPLYTIARIKHVAVISRTLEVSPRIAERLYRQVGKLYRVLYTAKHHPEKILVVDGIGPRTMQKIKELGGIV